MSKNICIIHFNTPILTRCLVRSINKYTPGAHIYIFDNSNKEPFVNYFDNVTVLDNTKGQLINFDEVLKQYPGRLKSRGRTNNYGSAKHSMSIQKCIELIGEEFVLLDSDVLLKRDISPLWNKNYVWIAGIEDWTNKTLVGATKRKRVCPFLLYMNVEKMTELGITFYDDRHMLGLDNGPKCEEYETGVWMYEITPKSKRKIINYNDYIVHFRAGSWLEDARTKQRYKQINPLKWLEKHKDKWLKPGEVLTSDWKSLHVKEEDAYLEKKMKMAVFERTFDHIYCIHDIQEQDRLPKLKSELQRVGIDENARYFSWKCDFPSPVLDCVFDNKNMNTDVVLRFPGRKHIKKLAMLNYEIIKEAYSVGYERILILGDDIRFHGDFGYIEKALRNIPDTDVVMFDKMVCSAPNESGKYKQYVKSLPEDSLYGSMNDSRVFFIFSSCYSLNRDAMKRIIDIQEKKLLPADTPLNDKELTGSFAVTNLAIRDPELRPKQSETYDKIGLDVSLYGKNLTVEPEPEEPVKSVAVNAIRKSLKPKTIGAQPRVQASQLKKTLAIQKPVIEVKKPEPKKIVTRKIHAKTSGHNKLYDVY